MTATDRACGKRRSSGTTIEKEMTILDIVSRFRQTERVFKRWEERTGVCLCCQALFEPLDGATARYGLDLEALLTDLRAEIGEGRSGPDLETVVPSR